MGLLRTPLYDRHVAAGGRIVEFAGYEMPVQYSGVIQEHLAVRRGVGVFDVSHMGEFEVTGPRARAAIDRLVSNDIATLPPGKAIYNMLCNETGGVVDDLYVYCLGQDDFIIVVNASNRHKDFAWMTAKNPDPAGAKLVDASDRWGLLAVQGRGAVGLLAGNSTVDCSALPRFGIARTALFGVPGCLVARTGYTGEDGFELFVPADRVGEVWDAVLGKGALPCGLGARDTLRLEVRNALYGHEIDDTTSPFAAGLGWVVKLDKPGGFVGRDAVAATKGKAARRLAGLLMQDSRIPRDGMAVLDGNGAVIGKVTSGTRSPCIEKGVALCYLDVAHLEPGTAVQVDVRGKVAPAVVHKGPFYLRDY